MSELSDHLLDRPLTTDEDYRQMRGFLIAKQVGWEQFLNLGLKAIIEHLDTSGYHMALSSRNPDLAAGNEVLGSEEVLLSGRVKEAGAIVAKMRRFGEPLRVMLDVWGYRLVVADEDALDAVADLCAELWATPTPTELLLRNGELQFQPRRDYRRRDHAGLSTATTNNYDQAVHLNRKAPFGITEVQVMTLDLYRRVHCTPAGQDSHDTFVARRQALFEKRDR